MSNYASPPRDEGEAEPHMRDIGHEVMTILDQTHPDRGYQEHTERVGHILRGNPNFEPRAELDLAVQIHDAYDFASKHPDHYRSQAIKSLINEALRHDDRQGFLAAVGYADSAQKWEDLAEEWRDVASARRYPGGIHEPILTEAALAARDIRADLDKLKSFRPGITGMESIVGALKELDIEGLLLKQAEVRDNISNPNPDRPISQWQDIMELLSVYVPALELSGFTETALQAEDEAYQTLHANDPLLYRAKEIHTRALGSQSKIEAMVVQNATSILGSNIEIGSRVKTIGSTANKILQRGTTDIGDALGVRVIIPDTVESEWQEKAEHLHTALQESGLERATKNKGMEVYLGRDTKGSGYKAIHLNYRDAGIAIEVQVVTETAHAFNQTHASRTLYKAMYGVSEVSQALRRRYFHRDTANDAILLQGLFSNLQEIRDRADHYREELNAAVVRPQTLERLAETDSYAESSNVLAVIREMRIAGNDAILPPVYLSRGDFRAITEQIMPGLLNHDLFQQSYHIAKLLHGSQYRNDSNYLESHILPATVAYMYDEATRRRFDDWKESITQICILLLHDSLEDIKEVYPENSGEYAELQLLLEDLPDEIIEGIFEMTKPNRRPDESDIEREKRYIDQISDTLLPLKARDRLHNLLDDLNQLQRLRAQQAAGLRMTPSQATTFERIKSYYAKSQYLLARLAQSGFEQEVAWVKQRYQSLDI